jgi:hypothetical protein
MKKSEEIVQRYFYNVKQLFSDLIEFVECLLEFRIHEIVQRVGRHFDSRVNEVVIYETTGV